MSGLRGARPNMWLGVAVSVAAVAAATLAIYPLKHIAPVVSLSVVYLPAVLLAATYWGLALGVFTSLLSAAAFNFFHLPPVGKFTIADSRNWVALGAFMIVALVAGTIAELARARTLEAERREAEAGLAAALARELLLGEDTGQALATTARRVAEALGLRSAAIERGEAAADERRTALALRDADGPPDRHPARTPRSPGGCRRAASRAGCANARGAGRDRAAPRRDAGGGGRDGRPAPQR